MHQLLVPGLAALLDFGQLGSNLRLAHASGCPFALAPGGRADRSGLIILASCLLLLELAVDDEQLRVDRPATLVEPPQQVNQRSWQIAAIDHQACELGKGGQPAELGEIVVAAQIKLLQVHLLIQATDLGEVVVAEVEILQCAELVEPRDLGDLVVAQVQLDQVRLGCQVLDLAEVSDAHVAKVEPFPFAGVCLALVYHCFFWHMVLLI